MNERFLDKTWEYLRQTPSLLYRLVCEIATHETIIQVYTRPLRASLVRHLPRDFVTPPPKNKNWIFKVVGLVEHYAEHCIDKMIGTDDHGHHH